MRHVINIYFINGLKSKKQNGREIIKLVVKLILGFRK